MEFNNIKAGLTSSMQIVVSNKDTAIFYGSGTLEVFATPAMISYMEHAAMICVDAHLPNEYTTVGTKIDVKHLAATPVGMSVFIEAKLLEVDRKRLLFKVEAYDQKEKIGEGFHERFIIEKEKFLNKTYSKLAGD
ncbi:thioesterase family protein [Caldicellulosiruptoraceae bacterium PP1]